MGQSGFFEHEMIVDPHARYTVLGTLEVMKRSVIDPKTRKALRDDDGNIEREPNIKKGMKVNGQPVDCVLCEVKGVTGEFKPARSDDKKYRAVGRVKMWIPVTMKAEIDAFQKNFPGLPYQVAFGRLFMHQDGDGQTKLYESHVIAWVGLVPQRP